MLSATSAGVKDVREVLAAAKHRLEEDGRRTVLFIDEIHRFTKSQQDALLPAVEDGIVVLVGATTENPFFEVNSPLISRSTLFRLEPLGPEEVAVIIQRALADTERGMGDSGLEIDAEAMRTLADRVGGDARLALNRARGGGNAHRVALDHRKRRRRRGAPEAGGPLRQDR